MYVFQGLLYRISSLITAKQKPNYASKWTHLNVNTFIPINNT